MNYYILNLIIILIIFILSRFIKNEEKKNKFFIIVAFIQLFLFLALRDINVGIDLQNYIPFFNRFKILPWSQILQPGLKEYGFRIYVGIVAKIIKNQNVFLAITAFLSLIGVYKLIRKNSKDYMLSIYIYITFNFYIFLFSGLRQAIAMSIGLLAIEYSKERKFFKYVLLILLASSFHISALVLLPAYFLERINIKEKYVPIIGIGVFGCFLFRRQIVGFFVKAIYTNYVINVGSGSGYNYLFLLMLLVIITTINKKQLIEADMQLNNMLYNFILVATIIQTFSSAQGEIVRLTMYYSVFIILLIPNFIKTIKDRRQQYFVKFCVITILLGFYLLSMRDSNTYQIYKSFLQI